MAKFFSVIEGNGFKAWLTNDKVMLAKCKTTGRFIKRENIQFIIDNISLLSIGATSANVSTIENDQYEQEFYKAINFYNIRGLDNATESTRYKHSPILWRDIFTSN